MCFNLYIYLYHVIAITALIFLTGWLNLGQCTYVYNLPTYMYAIVVPPKYPSSTIHWLFSKVKIHLSSLVSFAKNLGPSYDKPNNFVCPIYKLHTYVNTKDIYVIYLQCQRKFLVIILKYNDLIASLKSICV